jgi:hypothetical protein
MSSINIKIAYNIVYAKLENTERPIKNGQSRETGNIGYTRRRKKSLFISQYDISHRDIVSINKPTGKYQSA